jgi:hypothetical protein
LFSETKISIQRPNFISKSRSMKFQKRSKEVILCDPITDWKNQEQRLLISSKINRTVNFSRSLQDKILNICSRPTASFTITNQTGILRILLFLIITLGWMPRNHGRYSNFPQFMIIKLFEPVNSQAQAHILPLGLTVLFWRFFRWSNCFLKISTNK